MLTLRQCSFLRHILYFIRTCAVWSFIFAMLVVVSVLDNHISHRLLVYDLTHVSLFADCMIGDDLQCRISTYCGISPVADPRTRRNSHA